MPIRNKQIDENNPYSVMQRESTTKYSAMWNPTGGRDHVVGSFDAHNAWPEYEMLFDGLDTSNMVALDFGCGPGRNIIKYWNRFKRIDGADISKTNVENVRVWAEYNNIDVSEANFYHMNGIDLRDVPSDTYDIVFSTIAIQHICVYDIRRNIFEEFYRILKPGGLISIQMGFNGLAQWAVPAFSSVVATYFENKWDAQGTGGEADVIITDANDIKSDMEDIGFTNFFYRIGRCGPGDKHNNWIFFRAYK